MQVGQNLPNYFPISEFFPRKLLIFFWVTQVTIILVTSVQVPFIILNLIIFNSDDHLVSFGMIYPLTIIEYCLISVEVVFIPTQAIIIAKAIMAVATIALTTLVNRYLPF
jgi:hypothetical protein